MTLENRCFGCMAMLPEGSTSCPHCGYENGVSDVTGDILREGSIIAARYMLGRVLRRTAYEIRYLAYDCLAQRTVYVDEFYPAGSARRRDDGVLTVNAGDSRAMETAIRETCNIGRRAVRAGKLNGFAAVLDVFGENGTVYTVLEEVRGAEMGKKDMGKADYQSVCDLLRTLSTTLSQLHRMGIYHGSLCPGSIVVSRAGNACIVGLGVAEAEFRRSTLKPTEPMGMDYIAPEAQSAVYGVLSARTDIFSLAAIASAMLSGKAPAAIAAGSERFKLKGLNKTQLNCLRRALSEESGRRQRSVEGFYEQFSGELSMTRTSAADALPQKKDKKSLFLAVAGAALILLGLALLMLSPRAEKMPDLSGMTVSEAEQCLSRLESAGVELLVIGKAEGEGEADTVLSQKPAAGKTLKDGETVKVILCRGKAGDGIMPSLYAETEAYVREWADNNKLVVHISKEYNSTVAENLVIAQEPQAGTPIGPGTELKLVISLGVKAEQPPVSAAPMEPDKPKETETDSGIQGGDEETVGLTPDKGNDSSRPPAVSTQPEPPAVSTQPEPPVVSTQPEPPVVSTQPEPPVVSTQPEPPVVSTQPEQPAVSTQPEQPVVSTQPEQPTVSTPPETSGGGD